MRRTVKKINFKVVYLVHWIYTILCIIYLNECLIYELLYITYGEKNVIYTPFSVNLHIIFHNIFLAVNVWYTTVLCCCGGTNGKRTHAVSSKRLAEVVFLWVQRRLFSLTRSLSGHSRRPWFRVVVNYRACGYELGAVWQTNLPGGRRCHVWGLTVVPTVVGSQSTGRHGKRVSYAVWRQ